MALPDIPLPPIAVLDANVLFPASLRDTLLRAAEKDLYRLRISAQIWDEVVRNLIGTGKLTTQQAARLDGEIRAFLTRMDALVEGYEKLVPTLSNDPGDRHLLAAAITAQAQTIVTFNLKDFPGGVLAPYGIMAEHPDTFLLHLAESFPEEITEIVREQAADLKNPPLTVVDVLATLAQHVPAFANSVRDRLERAR